VGAAKSGTSSMHDILIKHPDIFLPEIKETKFFSLIYDKGCQWYLNKCFKNKTIEKAVGEIYLCMSSKEIPKRLYETLGKDINFFDVLRNPADRVCSIFLAQKQILNRNLMLEVL